MLVYNNIKVLACQLFVMVFLNNFTAFYSKQVKLIVPKLSFYHLGIIIIPQWKDFLLQKYKKYALL